MPPQSNEEPTTSSSSSSQSSKSADPWGFTINSSSSSSSSVLAPLSSKLNEVFLVQDEISKGEWKAFMSSYPLSPLSSNNQNNQNNEDDDDASKSFFKTITNTKNKAQNKKALSLMAKHGIPSTLRRSAWSSFCKTTPSKIDEYLELKKTVCERYGLFLPLENGDSLKKDDDEDDVGMIDKTLLHTIEVDLNRTYSNHPYFSNSTSVADPDSDPDSDSISMTRGMITVKRMLITFAIDCKDIGYLQGMNYIAAFLLLSLGAVKLGIGIEEITKHNEIENEAYQIFKTLITRTLKDYYTPNLPYLLLDTSVLSHTLGTADNELWKHLKVLDADVDFYSLITPQEFIPIFVTTLNSACCCRVWDSLLFLTPDIDEGYNECGGILIYVTLCILNASRDELLVTNNVCDAISVIRKCAAGIENFYEELLKPYSDRRGEGMDGFLNTVGLRKGYHESISVSSNRKRSFFSSYSDSRSESFVSTPSKRKAHDHNNIGDNIVDKAESFFKYVETIMTPTPKKKKKKVENFSGGDNEKKNENGASVKKINAEVDLALIKSPNSRGLEMKEISYTRGDAKDEDEVLIERRVFK